MGKINTIMEILEHITEVHSQGDCNISNHRSNHLKDWKNQPLSDKASSKEEIPQQATAELLEPVLKGTRQGVVDQWSCNLGDREDQGE